MNETDTRPNTNYIDNNRCVCYKVEVFEHNKNSGIYKIEN